MDSLLADIQGTAMVYYLRFGQWGYGVVNTVHLIGITLLVGGILPLDLRLLGFWRSVPRAPLVRVLVPMAATGLAIAVAGGLLLFSVHAVDYANLWLMQIKLALVALGTLGAILLHTRGGRLLEGASEARLAKHGALSMTCWLGALVCGRLIAYLPD